MRAAVYAGGGKPLTIERVADPAPGPDDVVIRVRRCGVCGTDLHLTSGHAFDFKAGSIPGHEYAGEVVEVGENVRGFRPGDLVTAEPSPGCGACEACRRGVFPLCLNLPGTMGGFGEFLRAPAGLTLKLPAGLSLADGALVEPLAIGLNGVKLARLAPGDRVLVLGAGAVALTTVYWARRLGAGRIAAMSRSPRRQEMALAMGADVFVQYGEGEAAELLEALGGPPDVVFECVGAPGFLAKAIGHVRQFGRVLSLGFCLEPDPIMAPIAGLRGVSLQFPIGYTLQDFRYAADVMDKGHVDPKLMITSVVSLADLPQTLDRLRAENSETKVHVAL